MATPTKIVIGSRDSELAMVQTRAVEAMLKAKFPDMEIEVKTSLSYGDQVLDKPLAELAAKDPGLFTKKLEVWLLSNICDVAVHSLKDMPTRLPEGLALAAITERADPEDALVVRPDLAGCGGLAGLPASPVIGTSSLRRAALLRRLRPDAVVVDIRGNLQTRYGKLEHGHEGVKFDAIVLAVAGLKRLGWDARMEEVLPTDTFPFSVGQGALGVECRAADPAVSAAVFAAVNHAPTAARCTAERAMLRGLEGGCQVPIGVSSSVTDGVVAVHGMVMSLDGAHCVEDDAEGPVEDAAAVGEKLAALLRSKGADAILGNDPPRPITYGSAEFAGASTTE